MNCVASRPGGLATEPANPCLKVSVVMPTYNRAYIIRDAIQSALQQTYGDFELIIVDDGSSDNTREIVEQCAPERVRYIRHEQNRGCSAAYNTGIAAATGEVISFLDSDDLWQPDYLERQVGFLCRHPEIDAVFTDTEIRGETTIPSLVGLLKIFPKLLSGKQSTGEFILSGREMYLCLLEEVPIKPTAFLVRREVLERSGVFDEAWPSGTDWDLFLRISHSTTFGFSPLPLVAQRRTDDATHQKFRELDKLFLLQVFTNEKRKIRNDREATVAINRGISSHCNDLAFHYLHTAKRGKAIRFYLRGFTETGDFAMFPKVMAALIPLSFRRSLKRMLGRAA